MKDPNIANECLGRNEYREHGSSTSSNSTKVWVVAPRDRQELGTYVLLLWKGASFDASSSALGGVEGRRDLKRQTPLAPAGESLYI